MTTQEKGLTLHRYWSSDCGRCKLKAQCTPAPERKISRWEHEEVVERMQERLNYLPMASHWRRETAEHVFGTLKSWMEPAHFLTKRLRNMRTEMSLQALAYNMKRATQILGGASIAASDTGLRGFCSSRLCSGTIAPQTETNSARLSAFPHALGRKGKPMLPCVAHRSSALPTHHTLLLPRWQECAWSVRLSP